MINDLALFETELEGVSSTDEESGNIKQEISNIIFETDNVRDGVQFGVASSIQEQLIEAFVTFEKNNDVGVNEKEIKMIPPSYSPVSNHF